MMDHRTADAKDIVMAVRDKMAVTGASIGQLERETGITRQSLNKYLRGKGVPTQMSTRKRLVDWVEGEDVRPRFASPLEGPEDVRVLEQEVARWRAKYDTLLDITKDLMQK